MVADSVKGRGDLPYSLNIFSFCYIYEIITIECEKVALWTKFFASFSYI